MTRMAHRPGSIVIGSRTYFIHPDGAVYLRRRARGPLKRVRNAALAHDVKQRWLNGLEEQAKRRRAVGIGKPKEADPEAMKEAP